MARCLSLGWRLPSGGSLASGQGLSGAVSNTAGRNSRPKIPRGRPGVALIYKLPTPALPAALGCSAPAFDAHRAPREAPFPPGFFSSSQKPHEKGPELLSPFHQCEHQGAERADERPGRPATGPRAGLPAPPAGSPPPACSCRAAVSIVLIHCFGSLPLPWLPSARPSSTPLPSGTERAAP